MDRALEMHPGQPELLIGSLGYGSMRRRNLCLMPNLNIAELVRKVTRRIGWLSLLGWPDRATALPANEPSESVNDEEHLPTLLVLPKRQLSVISPPSITAPTTAAVMGRFC